MKKNIKWLLTIMIIGLGIRFWQLDSLPAILNRDEAAVAYNSYLLMEAGRDEWGRSWPLALESFGDYKLPGYPVILMPFLAVFGLFDWVVRLPSVFAGVILIPLVYSLSKKLKLSDEKSLLVSFLVAISPVFVFYSRMAFEANLALTYLIGIWWTLLSIKDKPEKWHYFLLFGLLLLAIFTYNTPLLLLPVLMIYVALLFPHSDRKKLITVEAILAAALLVGAAALLPILNQKSGITIFTDETIWSQWVIFNQSLDQPWRTIIGNKYIYYLWLMAKNLFSSLSSNFLVSNGGAHPWHSLPSTGHIFGIVYSFFYLGLIKIILDIWQARKKLSKIKPQLSLLFLAVASLLPAVITVDAPHATRSLFFFVILQILAVIGIDAILKRIAPGVRKLVWRLTIITIALSGVLHAQRLFLEYPGQQTVFQVGFEKAVKLTEEKYPDTPVAIIDPSGYHYILLAWYLKLPADDYFTTVVRQDPDLIGFRYGQQLTHYHFIVDEADRSENEPVLIQWSEENDSWQIETDL